MAFSPKLATEIYPNITWEHESHKVLTGSEWQKATASMVRAAYSNLESMEQQIKDGKDPLEVLEGGKEWLTDCLFSANIENFT